MRYEIGIRKVSEPLDGATFEVPDGAEVLTADHQRPGLMTVYYMTPAPEAGADADKVAVGRDCPWCGDEVTDQADALDHLNECPPADSDE